MSVKQVIVVRNDLNMRKGKIGAQVAHASSGFLEEIIWNSRPIRSVEKTWRKTGRTKIVVQAGSEEELLALYQKAKEAGLQVHLVQDAGRTEFNGVPTYTSFAVGPDESEAIDKITGQLRLL